jgi:hypothetical protein
MLPNNSKELQMRSSKMTRRLGTFSVPFLTCASVLLFHSAAFAQQADPDAKDSGKVTAESAPDSDAAATPEAKGKQQQPQDLPPEYGPPPGYRQAPPSHPRGYPPPGYGPYYYDGYGPQGYGPQGYGPQGYPPPPPRYYRPRPYQHSPVRYYPEPLAYRPFFFGVGLGVGGIGILPYDTTNYENASRAGLGYSLRFGFGVSPRWSIVFSADGAQAYFDGVNVSETAWTIGPQVFLTPKLYLRGGVGAATYSQDTCDTYDSYGDCYGSGASDSGMAVAAAVGFEFMQSYHTSLALEASGTMGYYPNKDKVSTFGINFVLNLF